MFCVVVAAEECCHLVVLVMFLLSVYGFILLSSRMAMAINIAFLNEATRYWARIAPCSYGRAGQLARPLDSPADEKGGKAMGLLRSEPSIVSSHMF